MMHAFKLTKDAGWTDLIPLCLYHLFAIGISLGIIDSLQKQKKEKENNATAVLCGIYSFICTRANGFSYSEFYSIQLQQEILRKLCSQQQDNLIKENTNRTAVLLSASCYIHEQLIHLKMLSQNPSAHLHLLFSFLTTK